MKKIKPYDVFNESLKDKIKGQEHEEIMNKIHNMSQDELNDTLISILYKENQDYLVKKLVEGGADVNFGDGKVISRYVYKKDKEMVKYLIENGSKLYHILLSYADKNDEEMIKYLINKGADVQDNDDYLFRRMIQYENINMIKYLLDNYDIDIETTHSYPLRQSASFGNYEMVKLFLEYGADPNCEDDDAIEMAEDNGHDDVLELLKEYVDKNNN
jgi:ankyrin repeat protein